MSYIVSGIKSPTSLTSSFSNLGPKSTHRSGRRSLNPWLREFLHFLPISPLIHPPLLPSLLPVGMSDEEALVKKKELLKHPNIILGLSSLVEKINQGQLYAAAFSANLEPKFITRQIMTLALSKRPNMLLLIVPNLEELLDSVFNIKSYTFGMTTEDNEFTANCCAAFKEISARFPNPVKVKYSRQRVVTAPVSKQIRKKPQPLLLSIDFDALYLKRTESGGKAWTPTLQRSQQSKTKAKNEKEVVKQWSDFISLDDDDHHAGEESTASGDLNEERVRLKALLLSSIAPMAPESSSSHQADDDAMECDEEDATPASDVFLKPEETSGNQWASLLKPENLTMVLNKQQKRKEKRQRRKENSKAASTAVPFHPMKVHKVQPNPMKIKKKKIKKAKK